jgi:glucose/mannose-6-phosphate isomerase
MGRLTPPETGPAGSCQPPPLSKLKSKYQEGLSSRVLSLKEVEKVDRAGLWQAYQSWPDAYARAMTKKLTLPDARSPRLVVLVGMGGSGSACDIVADCVSACSGTPVMVVKDYDLPKYVREGSLVLAVSLSGDTKEVLLAFEEAVGRGCDVVGVSSGGTLEERCKTVEVPHNRVERLMVPRASLPGMVVTSLRILGEMGVADVDHELREASGVLSRRTPQVHPSVQSPKNQAKKLARLLYNKRAMAYTPARYQSIGHHFAASMNENAKVPVDVGNYPEIFHNEIETWRDAAGRAVVLLRGRDERIEIRRRLARTRSLFSKAKIPWIELGPTGGALSAMLDWCLVLDMASIYVAVLRKTPPVETPLLDKTRAL